MKYFALWQKVIKILNNFQIKTDGYPPCNFLEIDISWKGTYYLYTNGSNPIYKNKNGKYLGLYSGNIDNVEGTPPSIGKYWGLSSDPPSDNTPATYYFMDDKGIQWKKIKKVGKCVKIYEFSCFFQNKLKFLRFVIFFENHVFWFYDFL